MTKKGQEMGQKEQWRTMSDDEMYGKISGKLGYTDSKRLPVILSRLFPPIEAQMILHMPAKEEDLVQKMSLDRGTVDKHLKHLYEGGICNPGRVGWRMLPTYWQLKDAASPSSKFDWEREGLVGVGSVWSDFEEQEWFPRQREEYRTRAEAATGPTGRIIPYWKAIDGIPGVEWYDDMRQILKKVDEETEDGIGLGRCACRWIHGNLDDPLWVCFNFGRFAKYNYNRDAFKRISYDEGLQVVDTVMEAGLVQRQSPNARVVERQICNCGGDGCPVYGLQNLYIVSQEHSRVAPSRFVPVVDPEKCIACGACVQGCRQRAAVYHFYEDINRWRSWTDPDRCMGVGHCVIKCPTGARTFKLVHPPEFVPEWADILPKAQRTTTGATG